MTQTPRKTYTVLRVVTQTSSNHNTVPVGMMYRACQKVIPLKNFANFSRTIEKYDAKFYTQVTHSIVRKYGKFRYIISIIDKIMLLLVMAT